MTPKKGQYVRAFFYNGAQAEGFVVVWTDEKSVLASKNGTLAAVIKHTEEDVMLYELIFPPKTATIASAKTSTSSDPFRDQKLEKVAELRAITLAEEMAAADRLLQSSSGERYAFPFTQK
jgi:hypothetical protein